MLSVKHNHSPWLHQLERTRPATEIDGNIATDVAVIGGGIAGISTAFFLLRDTEQEVTLIEAHKIAHGATGHNAGQIASYFERPFRELVSQFGLKMAANAEQSIHGAWQLFEEMYRTADVETPLAKFEGYAGCKSLDHLFANLVNNRYRRDAGIPLERILIARDIDHPFDVLKEYEGLYEFTTHADILRKLQTRDRSYIAALSSQKGCVNSAKFCEEVLLYLLEMYADRFQVYEHTLVDEVRLTQGMAELKAKQFSIWAHRVVLCTNGFESISIKNEDGPDIDAKFHHMVKGAVGYMVGYVEKSKREPAAISYLRDQDRHTNAFESTPYYYLTRRAHELGGQNGYKLVCVGGPEALLEDTTRYSKEHPYPKEAQEQFDEFLREINAGRSTPEYEYRWHGLMGYTPTGVRCVGPEPINSVLMYNLGCNGVGILSSIYGGHRIARYVRGEAVEVSIFDPIDQTLRRAAVFLRDEEWIIVLGALTAALCSVISVLH